MPTSYIKKLYPDGDRSDDLRKPEVADSLTELKQQEFRETQPVRTKNQGTFNPRTEVSADARHITRTLWIIFVLMPFVVAVLYEMMRY